MTKTTTVQRITSLDFLRGIAVLLVVLCHSGFSTNLERMGWSGVDLFFVLSGFLVSGLLFNEYKKNEKINGGLFLIRRGFKIYPLFYLLFAVTLLKKYFNHYPFTIKQVLAEAFFFQNYTAGLWTHTWSLAVEEHFYFFLAFLFSVLAAKKVLHKKNVFLFISFFIFIFCLVARLITFEVLRNEIYDSYKQYNCTHLRIDSLFFGVLIAYFYHFEKEKLIAFTQKYRWLIFIFSVSFFLPVFFFEISSFYISTIGLTLLYLGFGGFLLLLFVDERNEILLQKIISKSFYQLISFVGFYSYSIYLWHILFGKHILDALVKSTHINISTFLHFVLYVLFAVIPAILISEAIEKPFLILREKWFPKK